MHFIAIIGILASVGTGVSLLPQLIKIIKTKKTDDISFWMLFFLLAGLGLWVCYGVLKKDWIIIISNSFSLSVNICIVIITLYYNYKK
jgi:MtN3 and saliva related transmembrane protein